MHSTGEEEVYITMVVVRRPVRQGQAALDHARLTETILQGLSGQVAPASRPLPGQGLNSALAPRFPGRRRPRQYSVHPVYLGLCLLCLIGAAYGFYMLLP
jgi:hypothetical protein